MNFVLNSQKAIPLTQASIAYGSITSSYQLVGSVFSAPLVQLIIISTMNDSVQFSWDGINAFIPIVSGATVIIDVNSNKISVPANSGAYVKLLGSPSSGSLYVSGFTV